MVYNSVIDFQPILEVYIQTHLIIHTHTHESLYCFNLIITHK